MAAKVPKKVVGAFFPEPIHIATISGERIVLREFSIASLMFLSRISHPLVMHESSGGDKVTMTNDQTMQLLFVLSRPVDECKAILDNGDDEFETAVLKFADTLPVRQLGAIREAVLRTFLRAWETGLATIPPGEKKTS
jgi:hypothetical protein